MIVAVVEVVLVTALATLGAFLYNLAAPGWRLEVTLRGRRSARTPDAFVGPPRAVGYAATATRAYSSDG